MGPFGGSERDHGLRCRLYEYVPAFGGTPQNDEFSAAGPGKYFFDANGNLLQNPVTLGKVNISAPDGGATDVNDTAGGGDNVAPFFGTSAATPAAAAIGALLLQRDRFRLRLRSLPSSKARRRPSSSATDPTTVTGAGLVNAQAALGAAAHMAPKVSDFLAKCKSDVLFLNPNGAVAMWELSNTQVTGGGVFETLGAGWTVSGMGDFNGDGNSDILLSTAAGALAIWEMNGTTVIGGGNIGSLGAGWNVVGTGDFNDDGFSDILFPGTSAAQSACGR